MYNLNSIDLFRTLPMESLKVVTDNTIIRNHKSGSILFYEGDTVEYVYILLEGRVKLCKMAKGGKRLYMRGVNALEIINVYPTIENKPLQTTCEFSTDGVVGLLPIDVLKSFLTNIDFMSSYVKLLEEDIDLLEEKMELFTLYNAEQKVVHHLLNNLNDFSTYQKVDIAKILNITPETLSREMTKLSKENSIDCSGKDIIIKNADRMRDILNFY